MANDELKVTFGKNYAQEYKEYSEKLLQDTKNYLKAKGIVVPVGQPIEGTKNDEDKPPVGLGVETTSNGSTADEVSDKSEPTTDQDPDEDDEFLKLGKKKNYDYRDAAKTTRTTISELDKSETMERMTDGYMEGLQSENDQVAESSENLARGIKQLNEDSENLLDVAKTQYGQGWNADIFGGYSKEVFKFSTDKIESKVNAETKVVKAFVTHGSKDKKTNLSLYAKLEQANETTKTKATELSTELDIDNPIETQFADDIEHLLETGNNYEGEPETDVTNDKETTITLSAIGSHRIDKGFPGILSAAAVYNKDSDASLLNGSVGFDGDNNMYARVQATLFSNEEGTTTITHAKFGINNDKNNEYENADFSEPEPQETEIQSSEYVQPNEIPETVNNDSAEPGNSIILAQKYTENKKWKSIKGFSLGNDTFMKKPFSYIGYEQKYLKRTPDSVTKAELSARIGIEQESGKSDEYNAAFGGEISYKKRYSNSQLETNARIYNTVLFGRGNIFTGKLSGKYTTNKSAISAEVSALKIPEQQFISVIVKATHKIKDWGNVIAEGGYTDYKSENTKLSGVYGLVTLGVSLQNKKK